MTDLPPGFDRRTTAARGDIAAAFLRGKIEAKRYVEGERFTVLTETVDVKRAPRPDAPLDTQMRYGDTLVVYDDDHDGWGWGQSDRDGYVGYVAMSALGREIAAPTHRVIVNRTFVYPAPDMKQPLHATLPLDGRVTAEQTNGDFIRIRGHGFVFAKHLAPLEVRSNDAVAIAEQLIGVSYLWGGASSLGIDCSGLVQLAWSITGASLPRDTDMQEQLGEALPLLEDLSGFARGDLVFWRGHVGLMVDQSRLIHANAHHMLVAVEPLRTANDRILLNTGLPISSVRRLQRM